MSTTLPSASAVAQPGKATSLWAHKYRGATVEDLDPPPALSITPQTPISHALSLSYSHDYTHLTITSPTTRSLLGYLSIPHLKAKLSQGTVSENDEVGKAMMRFQRRGKVYKVITPDTSLEELEEFFFGGEEEKNGDGTDGKSPAAAVEVAQRKVVRDFAVVTDAERRFVVGVATVDDLEQFVKRRPN